MKKSRFGAGKPNRSNWWVGAYLGALGVLSLSGVASAGVFNTPRFINPGDRAFGVEPEFLFTNGAGVGGNLRYTQGLTDLSNVSVLVGTGSGPRNFRVGGNMTFDFFPDVEGQPGIGIATQALYYRMKGPRGQLEVTAIPYLHKTFQNGAENQIEPFVAVPVGVAFSEGNYHSISQVAIGAFFHSKSPISYVVELNVAINNADSGISGGILYSF
jgi:hypothetical protein